MSKTLFSKQAKKSWLFITKHDWLPSRITDNSVMILGEELGLWPVMVSYGGNYAPFDLKEFRKHDIGRLPKNKDGWCQVFYLPMDCERATGSSENNFTQWANLLLHYKTKTHRLAPLLKGDLPADIRPLLLKRGKRVSSRGTRFLSLEVVAFYVANQTETWRETPGWSGSNAIFRAKDRLSGLDIPVIKTPGAPDEEEINVDDVGKTPDNGGSTPPRVPKAGQGLRQYNPSAAVPPDAVPAKGPAPESIFSIGYPSPKDEDIEAEIAQIEAKAALLRAELEERKTKRERQFVSEACQGEITTFEVYPDRGEYRSLTITFPTGRVVTYRDVNDTTPLPTQEGSALRADTSEV
jgi:hypothetical protein